MRNLKRVLSLVLALVMAMSLMVVGTSAAFKDEADFSAEYVTAAEVLTNLNVLWGYEDGSFQPKGDITRAEVAALIYRAVTGDVTDAQKDVYSAMTNDFSDVKDGQWFAGYVNFCANAKYVAGYGDGTFGPNDKVTGYQTLAMILRAIGYDHNGEFIGEGWEMKTASIAQDIGLLENVQSEQLGKPATRELVAELIFQAMDAPMVKWVSIYEGYRPLDKDSTSLGQKTFKLDEVEGVVLANEYANLGDNDLSALKAGKTNIGGTEYNLTTDTSIIGEKVSVWVADKDAVSTPISQAKVTDWSNLDAAEWTDDQEDEWADAINGSTKFYNNYDAVNEEDLFSGKGIMVKAIDNDDDDDGIYDYVLTEKKTLTTIKNIDDDGEILLNANYKESDDVVGYTGADEGDVVLAITYDGATYIEKASSINGNVTGINTKDDTATIGGKAYMVSGIVFAGEPDVTEFDNIRDTYKPGSDWNGKFYTYYQDNYGNIRAYEKAGENATEYGLILDYDVYKSGAFQGDLTWRPQGGINFGDLYVKYLTVDNKVETAKVDVDFVKYFLENNDDHPNGDPYVYTNILVGDVVSYNINSDGEFTLAYTYDCQDEASVYTDDDRDLAYVDGTDQDGTYNVNDDLVAFYYVAAGCYTDSDLGNTLGINIPVYGVLTGADAIADLDGVTKELHQMDATAGDNTHVNKYGEIDMLNIRGHVDTFVDYCYVEDFSDYTSEKVDGEYTWTYDAINASGEPIQVVTKVKMPETDKQVWAYHSLNVNGEVVNALLPIGAIEQDQEKNVWFGDLHAAKNGQSFYVYEWNDQDGKNFDLPETGVFALVENFPAGGTTALDKDDCSTGYVVVVDGDVKAVFVTEKENGNVDYIDVNSVTIRGEKQSNLHLYVGSTIDVKEDYYTVQVGTGEPKDLGKTAAITVTKDWAGKDVKVSAYVTDGNTALDKLTKATLDGEQLPLSKGYDKLDDAIANAININLPNKDAPYAFVVNTGANADGVNLWGSVATASDLAATKTVTFAPQATLDGVTNNLAGINVGSYIIVRLQNDSTVDGVSDVAFYAYHIAGIK